MAELETGNPSVRQIQGFIKEGQEIELKLLTQDVIVGQVRWQDGNCICINTLEGQPITVWRHAIAYIKPQGGYQESRSLMPLE